MSVRAYLIERNEVDCNRPGFQKFEIYRDCTPFFNIWRSNNLIDIFRYFGYDGSNEDCVGDFELTDDQFECFMEDFEENTKNWSEYDLEIVKKIKKYFDEGNWLLQLEAY